MNFKGISRQHRKLIFGMQPFFEPTRKTTSKKMEDNLKKKYARRPQQKNENGRQPHLFISKQE
jgi:hypothetical protein